MLVAPEGDTGSGPGVLVTEPVRGPGLVARSSPGQRGHPQWTREACVLRLHISALSGLLGRARREAHHLPRLDADHQDQV